jgi:predicted ArsR family transcriptional regulator
MANHLERRRIEAQFAKGLLDTLADEIGRERAVAILAKAIIRMAEEAGAAFAEQTASGVTDLAAFAEILPRWQENDALGLDLHKREAGKLEFDVTHCRYADMYRELGLADLGAIFSCNRDGAFCTGFNPNIKLERTKTIMEGADHCDFRFSLPDDADKV